MKDRVAIILLFAVAVILVITLIDPISEINNRRLVIEPTTLITQLRLERSRLRTKLVEAKRHCRPCLIDEIVRLKAEILSLQNQGARP